jgi:hypothetical protein
MLKKKVTAMFCINCERVWETTRTSRPCPRCASNTTIPLSKWLLPGIGAYAAQPAPVMPKLMVINGGLA